MTNKLDILNISDETFICPISQSYFLDPVMADDGHIYERKFIEKWLEKNNTSPMTRELMSDNFISNNIFNNMLKAYYLVHPENKPCNKNSFVDDLKNNAFDIDKIDAYMEIIHEMDNYIYPLNYTLAYFWKIFSNESFVGFLIDNFEKTIHKDYQLIHYICLFSNRRMIRKIINFYSDKDLNVQDKMGNTPICCAYLNSHLLDIDKFKIIKLFLENDVDLEIPIFRESHNLIHLVCSRYVGISAKYQFEIIKLLIEHGVDMIAVNKYGNNPLYFICSDMTNLTDEYQYEIIKLYSDNGVRMINTSMSGDNPLNVICSGETNLSNEYKFKTIELLTNHYIELDKIYIKDDVELMKFLEYESNRHSEYIRACNSYIDSDVDDFDSDDLNDYSYDDYYIEDYDYGDIFIPIHVHDYEKDNEYDKQYKIYDIGKYNKYKLRFNDAIFDNEAINNICKSDLSYKFKCKVIKLLIEKGIKMNSEEALKNVQQQLNNKISDSDEIYKIKLIDFLKKY